MPSRSAQRVVVAGLVALFAGVSAAHAGGPWGRFSSGVPSNAGLSSGGVHGVIHTTHRRHYVSHGISSGSVGGVTVVVRSKSGRFPLFVGSSYYRGRLYDADRYGAYEPLYMDTATLVELARRLDPQLVNPNAAPAEVEAPPEPEEQAKAAMLDGDYQTAITLYAELADQQRRQEAEDAVADDLRDRSHQRLLALAYAASGQFEAAAENFREAYDDDASLARKPLLGTRYFSDDAELRRLVQKAVGFANRERTSDSWYLVSMLMQAQGRFDRANQMMERAQAMRSTPVNTDDTPEHTDLPDKPELVAETGLGDGSTDLLVTG